MTSPLSLINSLINPAQPVVEEQVAPPQAEERIEFDEVTYTGKLSSQNGVASVRAEAAISYFHPQIDYNGEDALYLAVEFTVEADFSIEDESFDHEFGTEERYSHLFEDVKLVNIVIPHDASNYPLFKLPPEQHTHVIAFVKDALSKVDVESEPAFNWEKVSDGIDIRD